MTRIAFAFGNTTAWLGGLSFYDNLLTAISLSDEAKKHTMLAVIPGNDERFKNLADRFDEVHILPPSHIPEKIIQRAASVLSARDSTAWFSPESALSRSLRRAKAEIAFLKEDPFANFRVPNICWFPDFQYLRMPEMFSPGETQVYERVVRNTARFATRIMLSSQSVQKDFESVLPNSIEKTKVIPFVAWMNETVYEDDPSRVVQEYHLPQKFFYLPNQFWKHKNHSVVLEALILLKNEGRDIVVVASGGLDDYRNPSYPSELVSEIARCDLREQFILLGLLPRRDVIALLRQSLGLLQPSLFEGWSTSIEEAKSLGKPVLASNIAVHYEQGAPGAVYFDPYNARELADHLKTLSEEWTPGVDVQVESRAYEWMHVRAHAFGESFLSLVCDTVQA